MNLTYTSEGFPEFFQQAPELVVRDPLAAFLGAAKNGIMVYRYADAVRLAGHSCPTVAAAYLSVIKGLHALYGNVLPERGSVEVMMADSRDAGTAGVIASVATLLTGAAPETGFGGIGPTRRFARRGLLNFDQPVQGRLALRRKDNGQAVQIEVNEQTVPFAPAMKTLLPKAVSGEADAAELAEFARLWQERVYMMLVERKDDEGFIRITPLQP